MFSDLSERLLSDDELQSLTLGQLELARAHLILRGGTNGAHLNDFGYHNLGRIKAREVYARHAERILKRIVDTTSTGVIRRMGKAV